VQDRQLYAQILGIVEPWQVDRVELQLQQGEVHIYLAHSPEMRWPCPECGELCTLHDHQPERRWRHLDTCQYRTILHAQPPRSTCPIHGVKVVKLPWAEPSSRFTALFERLAIEWLKEASQQGVAALLGLSWDEIHNLMERAVQRGLERRQAEPIPRIGIDEKSFRKRHRYVTVVNDLTGARVLFVTEERKEDSLDEFWPTLTIEQQEGIQAIAMDMWDPYVASVREHLDDADSKIVFDKFHIAGHLGEAVDKVRRQENRLLQQEGDDRLVGTRYYWLRNPGNVDDQTWERFRHLRQSDLKTARAWAIKEEAMRLFDYVSEAAARKHFKSWYYWATHSRLEPVIKVARMMKAHLENIITYLKHRITNATSESINAKIQWVKYTARGFRNVQNLKTAIYFHCGGLDLAPSPTK
jgi:transposase